MAGIPHSAPWAVLPAAALLAAAILAAAPSASAGEAVVGSRAPEISASAWANLSGDEPTLASRKGRPVLLVFWGMDCTVCLCREQLKKCETAWRKHRGQGLEVLGLHVQEAPAEAVDLYSLRNDITFPMGSGGYNQSWGVKSVPMLFLVDNEGILVWQGDDLGGEFTKKLGDCLRSVDFMGETKFPKALRPLASLVVHRKFSKLIDKLVDFMADPKQAAEDKEFARGIKTKLEEAAERDLNRADGAIRLGDPVKGSAMLERISSEFKDHPLGRKADQRLKEVKADPEVKNLMKAADAYRRFRESIRTGDSNGSQAAADFLFKSFPDSLYSKKTRGLISAFDRVK